MIKSFAFLMVLFCANFSTMSFADGGGHNGGSGGDGHEHTGQFCSAKAPELCLHLGIPQHLNSSQEGKFMVHFLVEPSLEAKIDLTSVVLWMDSMGHGSAPTRFEKVGAGKYIVTNAWFIMPGTWSIKINFKVDGTEDQIIVPIEI
jgi:hypothetical protein